MCTPYLARSCNAEDRPFARLVSSPTFRRPRESSFPSNYSPRLPIADRARGRYTCRGSGLNRRRWQISTWPPSRLDLSKDLAGQPVTVPLRKSRFFSFFFFLFRPRYADTRRGSGNASVDDRFYFFLFCESGSRTVSNRAKWFR